MGEVLACTVNSTGGRDAGCRWGCAIGSGPFCRLAPHPVNRESEFLAFGKNQTRAVGEARTLRARQRARAPRIPRLRCLLPRLCCVHSSLQTNKQYKSAYTHLQHKPLTKLCPQTFPPDAAPPHYSLLCGVKFLSGGGLPCGGASHRCTCPAAYSRQPGYAAVA